jgi:hypothetical protein
VILSQADRSLIWSRQGSRIRFSPAPFYFREIKLNLVGTKRRDSLRRDRGGQRHRVLGCCRTARSSPTTTRSSSGYGSRAAGHLCDWTEARDRRAGQRATSTRSNTTIWRRRYPCLRWIDTGSIGKPRRAAWPSSLTGRANVSARINQAKGADQALSGLSAGPMTSRGRSDELPNRVPKNAKRHSFFLLGSGVNPNSASGQACPKQAINGRLRVFRKHQPLCDHVFDRVLDLRGIR